MCNHTHTHTHTTHTPSPLHAHRPLPPIGLKSKSKGSHQVHLKSGRSEGESLELGSPNEPFVLRGARRRRSSRQLFRRPSEVLLPRSVWLSDIGDLPLLEWKATHVTRSGRRGYWVFQTNKLQIHKSRAAAFHEFYDLAGRMFVFVS